MVKPLPLATGALAFALLGALVGWRMTAREAFLYRSENARTVDLVPGACPRTGLVARWELDRHENGRFADSAGLGLDLSLEGSSAPLAALRYGAPPLVEARSGHGVSIEQHHWLAAPNSRCFATGLISVAAWVKLDDLARMPTIVGKSTWPADGFWLLTTTPEPAGTERRLQLGFVSEKTEVQHVDAGYVLPLHEWHHVAFALDNEAHEVRFFVDGKPFGDVHRGLEPMRVNVSHPLYVGDDDGTGRWPWHGSLDDVRVWNRVVTEDEVARAFAGKE